MQEEIKKYDQSKDACDREKGYRHKHLLLCPKMPCGIAGEAMQDVFPSMVGAVWSENEDEILKRKLRSFIHSRARTHGRTIGAIIDRIRRKNLLWEILDEKR